MNPIGMAPNRTLTCTSMRRSDTRIRTIRISITGTSIEQLGPCAPHDRGGMRLTWLWMRGSDSKRTEGCAKHAHRGTQEQSCEQCSDEQIGPARTHEPHSGAGKQHGKVRSDVVS